MRLMFVNFIISKLTVGKEKKMFINQFEVRVPIFSFNLRMKNLIIPITNT